jgi:dienelactone hydrolase
MARGEDGQKIAAPAVVVVHESGRNMAVGRLIARGLSSLGLHAFLLQLPGYGQRVGPAADDPTQFLAALKQAVADVRRARDAVASLPMVQPDRIGLQGTSLGGFVTATVCGLDGGYQRKFVFLAGGNLHDVVLKGQRDAAKVRQRLQQAGLSDEQIMELARPIEPLRVAHRVDPSTTWLYSGTKDDVVPPSCCHAWATAAGLAESHHIQMPVDHYSGVTYLPKILGEIAQIMHQPSADPHADNLPTP